MGGQEGRAGVGGEEGRGGYKEEGRSLGRACGGVGVGGVDGAQGRGGTSVRTEGGSGPESQMEGCLRMPRPWPTRLTSSSTSYRWRSRSTVPPKPRDKGV